MAELTSLLGRQPTLPEWVYNGAILGIQGGTQVLKDKLEKAKAMDTAIAGAWCQDWEGARITMFGKQLMWNWEWDSEWYKGLDEEIPRYEAEGIRFLGYCNPFLATEKNLYAYASPAVIVLKIKTAKTIWLR
jgi:alpha-glucosidase